MQQDAMIQRHLLWKLYHITQEIEASTRQVEEANEHLAENRAAVVSLVVFGSEVMSLITEGNQRGDVEKCQEDTGHRAERR
jgi:intracellular sulfur oxidation DsrE/DsrF family protein